MQRKAQHGSRITPILIGLAVAVVTKAHSSHAQQVANQSRPEVIGIASGTDTSRLSRQRAQNGALDDLKKKVAKLGANGLVIKQTGFSGEEHEQNITAMAIYVP